MEATLQQVFRLGFDRYRERHGVSIDQYQAATAIMTCQGEDLGYEEWICAQDGHVEQQAHSCRHRSCPRCQHANTQRWLDKTQARLLPCDHYHVVFTLPHELNEIWQYNRQWSADHLFKASAETIRQLLNDERYLGADAGLLASQNFRVALAQMSPGSEVALVPTETFSDAGLRTYQVYRLDRLAPRQRRRRFIVVATVAVFVLLATAVAVRLGVTDRPRPFAHTFAGAVSMKIDRMLRFTHGKP